MSAVRDLYPLAPLQAGMLFHARLAGTSGMYVEQRWCRIDGPLDVVAFENAWRRVVERHDVLRTEFHWEDLDAPVQVVYDDVELPWLCGTLAALGYGDGDAQDGLARFLEADRASGFALDHAPLMRCALIALDDGGWQFVWTYHHLLLDGWCNGLLLREVMQDYATRRGDGGPSRTPSLPYRAYIDWLDARDVDAERGYWREALAGFEQPTRLDLAAPAEASDDYAVLDAMLGTADTARLATLAKERRLTLNTFVQAALALTVSRFGGGSDVVFGAAVSTRPAALPGAGTAVGLYLNTVPVRAAPQPQKDVNAWLTALQAAQVEREAHAQFPLHEIQAASAVTNGEALFDTLLVFENYPLSIEQVLGELETGLSLSELGGYERTNYALTVMAVPGEQLRFSLRYDAQRFADHAINAFAEHLLDVLAALSRGESDRVGELGLSIADDSGATTESPVATGEVALPMTIAARAANTPAHTALIAAQGDGEDTLSYAELEQRVAALATALAANAKHSPAFASGDCRGQRIAVLCRRGPLLPVALLAVMRAGAAWVPLAHDMPRARMAYVLADADVSLLLHDGELPENLPVPASLDLRNPKNTTLRAPVDGTSSA
ncbi:MAG: condensation domain-containing protein, partial [Pseudomonadota bacterium]